MKVYQINTVCGIGSTGNICVDLYRTLIKNKHKCRIAYGRGQNNLNINSYKIGNIFDVYSHVILSRITDKQGSYSKLATAHLLQDIKRYNPDIIQLHNIHGYYLNYEMLFRFLKAFGRPVVWTLHDCWPFTGHCVYYSQAACDKWKTQCYDCIQKKTYPKSIYYDNSRENYINKRNLFTSLSNLKFVVPSRWLADEIKKSFLYKYRVEVIPNGIDLSIFKPEPNTVKKKIGIEDKKIVLGVANIWDERKGLKDFLQLRTMLDQSYAILLVGMSGKEIKGSLPEHFYTLGRTKNAKELAKLYTAADVYFNASVEETMGLTTIEAMACGTPVVVYNATAIPEVVDDQAGIVVEKNNLDQVKQAIEEIESRKLTHMQETAKKFEKYAQYNKYIKIYNEVFKEGKNEI